MIFLDWVGEILSFLDGELLFKTVPFLLLTGLSNKFNSFVELKSNFFFGLGPLDWLGGLYNGFRVFFCWLLTFKLFSSETYVLYCFINSLFLVYWFYSTILPSFLSFLSFSNALFWEFRPFFKKTWFFYNKASFLAVSRLFLINLFGELLDGLLGETDFILGYFYFFS